MIAIVTSDVAGQVRGKGFPEAQLEGRRRFGIGWTPGNVMINCLGRIPASPFGAKGDLMIVPADGGDWVLDFEDGSAVEHNILGDIQTLEGQAWECCTRSFLRRALAALEAQGFRLFAAFEHEFWVDNADDRPGGAYAISSLRGMEAFAGDVIGAMRANGIEPDTFLPEFGPRQFEVTNEPAFGMKAADDAVKLREICRAVGRRHGHHVSFSPVVTRGIVGNGVHIHFSLTDLEGRPVLYDPQQPGELSSVGASFSAGVLKHAKALCALVAPSAISYERLKPHAWSAFCANLSHRDREAFLRICPYPTGEGVRVEERFNLEFRPGDATASPYLQLGALVFAGVEGLKAALPAPKLSQGVPSDLSAAEREAQGFEDLPHSLAEALSALENDAVAMSWLGPIFAEAYLMHKRGEIEMTKDTDIDELCNVYARAY